MLRLGMSSSLDFNIQSVDGIGSTYQWPQNKHPVKITTILIYFCTPALASQSHESKMIQLVSSTPHDIQNVKT